MKTLIVFYSRTGTTRKLALEIKKLVKADIEEIIDLRNRSGPVGYINAGKEATFKQLTEIRKPEKNPEDYDIIIIGTPVWAFTMSSAVRTYLSQNAKKIRKTAFFCTMQNSGNERTFAAMEGLAGRKPLATLTARTADISKPGTMQEIKRFVNSLKPFL